MKQFDGARIIQALSKLRRNRKFNGAKVVLKLRGVRSSDNSGRNARLRRDPIQSDLYRLLVELFRYIEKSVQNSPVVFGEPVSKLSVLRGVKTAVSSSSIAFSFVLSGEETSRERAPGTHPDTEFLRNRNMLAFDIALRK